MVKYDLAKVELRVQFPLSAFSKCTIPGGKEPIRKAVLLLLQFDSVSIV